MLENASTCTGPYAILIMLGIKRVENRSVCPLSADGFDGTAVRDEGYDYFWDLSNVVCFDMPTPCRGSTGMWQIPFDLSAQVTLIDEHTRKKKGC